MSAFCPPLTLSRPARGTASALGRSPRPNRVVRAAKSRRAYAVPLACAAENSTPEKPAESPAEKPAADAEEEQLDEAAMRAAEIHEVLTGLKDFKTRIIDDATKLAKKVRAPKKELEAALAAHPDIIKIDGHIAELEEELKVLGDR